MTLIYRRTQEEMPCTEHELNIAKLDGCRIIWLASPKEIVGREGKVSHLVCEIMQLGPADTSGRRSPVSTGETMTLVVDMVIKAAGQMPYEHLVKYHKLNENKGKVVINDKAVTNVNGVFAGGDCVNGGKEVVDAVQAGKEGAAAILEFLK